MHLLKGRTYNMVYCPPAATCFQKSYFENSENIQLKPTSNFIIFRTINIVP